MLGSFDETHQRFLATSKVDPHLTRLATEKRTLRDPFLDPALATFFSKVNKHMADRDLPCQRPKNEHKLSVRGCDVRARSRTLAHGYIHSEKNFFLQKLFF